MRDSSHFKTQSFRRGKLHRFRGRYGGHENPSSAYSSTTKSRHGARQAGLIGGSGRTWRAFGPLHDTVRMLAAGLPDSAPAPGLAFQTSHATYTLMKITSPLIRFAAEQKRPQGRARSSDTPAQIASSRMRAPQCREAGATTTPGQRSHGAYNRHRREKAMHSKKEASANFTMATSHAPRILMRR